MFSERSGPEHHEWMRSKVSSIAGDAAAYAQESSLRFERQRGGESAAPPPPAEEARAPQPEQVVTQPLSFYSAAAGWCSAARSHRPETSEAPCRARGKSPDGGFVRGQFSQQGRQQGGWSPMGGHVERGGRGDGSRGKRRGGRSAKRGRRDSDNALRQAPLSPEPNVQR